MKLNALLARTDALQASFRTILKEYIVFFKNKQSAFVGYRNTYSPHDGTIDEPSKRGFSSVITTVKEKLEWLTSSQADYINALFTQEKTNTCGNTVELKVDDISFGLYTSLELLRLKSLLELSDLKDMYTLLPTRTDSENWNISSEFGGDRDIYETDMITSIVKTTEKEQYILQDPNVASGKVTNYTPQIGVKTTTVELGVSTQQKFSGEISHKERAEILQRRQKLLVATIEALKVVNDTEVIVSDMTANKLFGYLHGTQK